ncbi:2263_t:CDS:1, partial [Cetraspora pellucida]
DLVNNNNEYKEDNNSIDDVSDLRNLNIAYTDNNPVSKNN